MRSATGDSKTHYNYAHTSTPKAASSHRYTAAKKNDQPTPAAPVAHTRYLSSSPAATLDGKTHGFVLRLPPQNIADATSCSHSNAICNRRCQNTLWLRTHKHTQSSFKPPLHCGKKKRPTDPSRTRRTHEVPFIVACSHFTRKNARFRAPASSPKDSPCNIHAAITMRSATGDAKTPYDYAHTSTPKAASSHRYTAAKKTTNRPQPHPSHTRGTFHRRLQSLYTEKHKVSCSGFLPKR